jgi:hypothetical protein
MVLTGDSSEVQACALFAEFVAKEAGEVGFSFLAKLGWFTYCIDRFSVGEHRVALLVDDPTSHYGGKDL